MLHVPEGVVSQSAAPDGGRALAAQPSRADQRQEDEALVIGPGTTAPTTRALTMSRWWASGRSRCSQPSARDAPHVSRQRNAVNVVGGCGSQEGRETDLFLLPGETVAFPKTMSDDDKVPAHTSPKPPRGPPRACAPLPQRTRCLAVGARCPPPPPADQLVQTPPARKLIKRPCLHLRRAGVGAAPRTRCMLAHRSRDRRPV